MSEKTDQRPVATCTCGEAWKGHPNPHALTCLMTAGRSPVELLDALDARRAKAMQCEADAAWIVAACSAVPALVAALRAVLADHREIHPDDHYCAYDGFVWPCPTYRAVAAALTEGGQAK